MMNRRFLPLKGVMMMPFSRHAVAIIISLFSLGRVWGATLLSVDECKRLSGQGDLEALYQMGVRHETGNGVRKDGLRALANYRKAADKGHREACRKMADLYDIGKIVSKNPVLAAKYRAMSVGEDGKIAETNAKAEEQKKSEKVDEIEVALDHIMGRNGKARDAKAGIRLLYAIAKNDPVAQRVFVEYWEKGHLDQGLATIGEDEWDSIVPWFKDQFDKGRNLKGGLILGNAAYRKKRYNEAIAYWQSAGMAGQAKAWFYIGKLHDARAKEEFGGGPECLHDDTKARLAYEKCLKIDPEHEDANYFLGLIYLFGNGADKNLQKALSMFSYLLRVQPNDKYYLYYYGLAGFILEEERFERKWPNVQAISKRCKEGAGSLNDKEYLRQADVAYESVVIKQKEYVEKIQKSAKMGCEIAKKFMEEYKR